MRLRTLLIILLAVVCGSSAAVGVSQLNRRTAAKDVKAVSVVVASENIPRGSVLTPENLTVRPWPSNMVPEGALEEIAAATDRTVMAPLVQGELVLDGKLADKSAGRGLASMIPAGMRAFTINTPNVASGVGGFVLPGNRVDVLLTTSLGGSKDPTGGAATTTLLQNVEILAVAQRLDAPNENKIDPKELKSVTLLVTPDQAAKLDLGMNKGILHLSLRNPADDKEADTLPATLAQLRFHQEQPLPGEASTFSKVVDLMGKLAATVPRAVPGKPALKSEVVKLEKTPPVLPVVEPPRRRVAQIYTLRGVHRGRVIIERPPVDRTIVRN